MPFFYHTLIDWHNADYKNDFVAYVDYLVASVELLCKNYGKIGGFWFDGFWDKPDADWQFDRLYGTIRNYQPTAMIINNTGLNALGQVSHKEIDSVTFERGKPCFVDCSDKPRAGEMCEGLTDHWGYAERDICVKSTKQVVETYVDCRRFGCNLLINTGRRYGFTSRRTHAGKYREVDRLHGRVSVQCNPCKVYCRRSRRLCRRSRLLRCRKRRSYGIQRKRYPHRKR